MEPERIEPERMGPGRIESGRWPYKPTALWRKLIAVIGLGAFTAICVAALVALVVAGAAVGALLLETLTG